jgi:hypothetical protein
MNRSLWIGIGIGSMLFACSGNDNPNGNGGGGSVQPGTKVSGLYIANSDDQTIARLDLDTHVVRPFQVGKEPSRIARAGTNVYVTLRNERTIVIFDDKSGDLEEVARIKTAAEPFGVAANDTRIYVAASVGGVVQEFDAQSHEALRSWEIAGEPKWLTLHPSNRSLYVGSTYGGRVTRIDLDTGRAEAMPVPEISSFSPTAGQPIVLTARVTGDLRASPDGKTLYAPMLYVDNTTEIPDVNGDSSTPPMQCGGIPTPTNSGGTGVDDKSGGMTGGSQPPPDQPPPPDRMGGCGGGYDQQKFNPVVTAMQVDPTSGVPTMSVPAEAISVNGFAIDEQKQTVSSVSGYPSSLEITSDSKVVLATIEGANAVIAINMDSQGGQTFAGGGVRDAPPSMGVPPGGTFGFSFRQSTTILVGAGARGIAMVGDHRAFVHAFFDHQIEELNLDKIRETMTNGDKAAAVGGGAPLPLGVPNSMVSTTFQQPQQLKSTNPMIVTGPTISQEAEEGRRLFFAANNPVMATVGAGVSCGTCHFDGRTDGVTWTFHRGQRQTPMLATDIKNALPVGWAGNVPSVADEGFNTSQKLMGGHGITQTQVASVEAFLYGQRTTDSPMKGVDDPRVQHGQQVFNAVGCQTCHNGPSHTNNQVYAMLGLSQVKTRPLASIAASAPYFHDGSAATLEDVIDRASRGEMGNAFTISGDDKADLVLFLQSL